jgi:CDP-2,3-bis-(O-geranylgeranyl)-sn-glycerol synthase
LSLIADVARNGATGRRLPAGATIARRREKSIHMDDLAVLRLLILIAVANGSPVLAKRIFGRKLAQPLDGHISFFDGRPLFGASKTIRGIVVSLLATAACAPLLGLDMRLGILVASAAMAGDLLSSFLKRRLALPPSSRAIGLDQIPESLFPLLVCREALALTAADIVAGTALFFLGEILLSRLLFRLHVRDRPY